MYIPRVMMLGGPSMPTQVAMTTTLGGPAWSTAPPRSSLFQPSPSQAPPRPPRHR